MLHFGPIDIRTDIFILIVSVILLCIQLFLCFHTKKKRIRFALPVFFLAAAVILAALGLFFDDWNQFAFFFLAGCSVALFLVCAIGIGVWKIFKK